VLHHHQAPAQAEIIDLVASEFMLSAGQIATALMGDDLTLAGLERAAASIVDARELALCAALASELGGWELLNRTP
jgi:hypothetical protein